MYQVYSLALLTNKGSLLYINSIYQVYNLTSSIYIFYWLIYIIPVQLPLHEPYFDFTLIRVVHRKNSIITSKSFTFTYLKQKSKLIAPTLFSMRRVVSTNPRIYSPCHGDSRLLAISYSCSRISGYNPFFNYILFFEVSLNSHFRISLFRNMWHVYSPQYRGHDDLSWSLLLYPI